MIFMLLSNTAFEQYTVFALLSKTDDIFVLLNQTDGKLCFSVTANYAIH